MNIAEKLRDLRNSKGYNQDQLAEILSVSVTAIRNYENIADPRVPKSEVLLAYSRHFKVSLEYLLDDNVTNKINENIDISKVLKLEDNTINVLKRISEIKHCNKAFNDLFISFNITSILEEFYVITMLSEILSLFKAIIPPVPYYDKEEKKFYFNLEFKSTGKLKRDYISNDDLLNFISAYEFAFDFLQNRISKPNIVQVSGYLSRVIFSEEDDKNIKNKIGLLEKNISNENYEDAESIILNIYSIINEKENVIEDYKNLMFYNINRNLYSILSDYTDKYEKEELPSLIMDFKNLNGNNETAKGKKLK